MNHELPKNEGNKVWYDARMAKLGRVAIPRRTEPAKKLEEMSLIRELPEELVSPEQRII